VSSTLPRPNLYAFADYRRYLAAYYDYAKAEQYGFSFRVFSRRAKIRSSNYLRLVIDGERNLTREMAGRFAEACELAGSAREFFCELVEYCQAKTTQERSRMYERLARHRPFREARRLESAQAEYHSHWYLPAIRELVRRPDFVDDPKWIGKQLWPHITALQAKRALELLAELGLLQRDAQGRLVQTSEIITTGPGPLGHHIFNYHHMMLERAAEALDALPREQRDLSCLTLCVSEEKLEELKQRVRAFRQELLRTAELDNRPERVVQINFQVFPLSIAAAPGGSGDDVPSNEPLAAPRPSAPKRARPRSSVS
jgi:uncharacterized protein (TIGR02147 family)